ncbi:MAG TPA: YtxH domain-containing protein [Gemmatimonadetes bacterium]|nr:YtxH domain-containing protein [Gemmatimonadota bacterium]
MDYDQEASSVRFVAGVLLGGIVAPETGNRTRRRIRKVAGELKESAGDHWEDLATDVKDKVDDAVRGARNRFLLKR